MAAQMQMAALVAMDIVLIVLDATIVTTTVMGVLVLLIAETAYAKLVMLANNVLILVMDVWSVKMVIMVDAIVVILAFLVILAKPATLVLLV
jgi:hypothetical protein